MSKIAISLCFKVNFKIYALRFNIRKTILRIYSNLLLKLKFTFVFVLNVSFQSFFAFVLNNENHTDSVVLLTNKNFFQKGLLTEVMIHNVIFCSTRLKFKSHFQSVSKKKFWFCWSGLLRIVRRFA